jgi:hypothetical protein
MPAKWIAPRAGLSIFVLPRAPRVLCVKDFQRLPRAEGAPKICTLHVLHMKVCY